MRKVLVEKTNLYLANVSVLYFKLHNLHWNIVGPQFKEIHHYLEELYNEFANVLDDVAELLKQSDETPYGSMNKYLSVATIEELEDKPCSIIGTIDILLNDFSHLKHQAQDLRYLAMEDDCYPLVNMMEDHLTNYSKTMWFLFSMQR